MPSTAEQKKIRKQLQKDKKDKRKNKKGKQSTEVKDIMSDAISFRSSSVATQAMDEPDTLR